MTDPELLDEVRRLRRQLDRERSARAYRADVTAMVARTAEMITRAGVAEVLVRGVSSILGAGSTTVAFIDGDNIRFVFGPEMPRAVAEDWPTAPLASENPMAAVLRGEADVIELSDPSQVAQWPLFREEAARSNIASFVAAAIRQPGGDRSVYAAIGVGWDAPHVLDADERELLLELTSTAASAFSRSEQTESDRHVARTLQRWLLPPDVPPTDGLEIGSLYVPGRDELAVGGDWYDVVPIDDETTAYVVGDVVGHNVRAAAEMGQVRHVLASSLMANGDPAQSLDLTDRYFTGQSSNTMATAIVMLFRASSPTVEIASAGHLPPMLVSRSSATRLIDCDVGPPIGAGFGGHTSVTTPFDIGTMLVAVTDGVVERRSEVLDDSLGDLCAAIDQLVRDSPVGASPMPAVTALLEECIELGAGDDDAAALLLRRVPVAASDSFGG